MAAGRDLLMGQLLTVGRILEPLMTDYECNWPGGNNMPGAYQVRRVLPAHFCRQGQGHCACNCTFNCLESLQHHRRFYDRSDHNHKQTFQSSVFSRIYRINSLTKPDPWVGND